MQGENKLKILEFLENSAQIAGDLFFIFTVPYGTSLARMEYLLRKRRYGQQWQKLRREKQGQFYDLMYRLRKDELIEGRKGGKNHFLKITAKGKLALEKFRLKKAATLPHRSKYESRQNDILKIIISDIPEKEKRKRNWLRGVLQNLKFTMLQKSVWIGKTKLPRYFIFDLKKLNLLSYVEIFAISKTGSLKQFKP